MLQTDIQDLHSLFPDLLDELLLPPEGVLDGVPDHLELPPALAQGQALGDDVEGDQLGLQSPLAVLLGPLYAGSGIMHALRRILVRVSTTTRSRRTGWLISWDRTA